MNPYRPFAVRLSARTQLSPTFVRLTLAGDDLGHCGPILLDQRVKLVLGPDAAVARLAGAEDWYAAWLAVPDAERPALRTYTLSAVRPRPDGSGEVDIDVAAHPIGPGEDAPGLRFALEAAIGTPTLLVAADVRHPQHDVVGVAWLPGEARDVVLVADETALPAAANILAVLAPDTVGRAVLEVPDEGDVRPLSAPAGVRVEWRVRARGERAVGVFGSAVGEVDDDGTLVWDEAEASPGRYGWVAGEAGWVRSLRAEARASGLTKGQVSFMGYWKRGVAA